MNPKQFLLLPFFFLLISILKAGDLKTVKRISIYQDDDIFITRPGSFIVTEKDEILIIDPKHANIRVFNLEGESIMTFGRKGMGPNEFVRPRHSAYLSPFILVADYGRKTFLMYKRTAKGFEYVDKRLSLSMGKDVQFIDEENFIVAGHVPDDDGNDCNLYSYNFKTKKCDYILPSHVVFGYDSPAKFLAKRDSHISYIGRAQYIDLNSHSIFMVWKGDTEVKKINRKTRKITKFGKESKHFVKPTYNAEMKQAFRAYNHRLIYKLRKGMSNVRDLFVTRSNKVGVTYVGPYKEDKGFLVMLQIYTTNGEFIKEVRLMYAKAASHYEMYFYFRKDDNSFFVLDTETSKEFDQFFTVHQFRIE